MRHNGLFAAIQVAWQTVALFAVYRLCAHATNIAALGLWSTSVAIMGLVAISDAGLTEILVREVSRSVAMADGPRLKGLVHTILKLVAVSIALCATLAIFPITLTVEHLSGVPEIIALKLVSATAIMAWLTIITVGVGGILEGFSRYDLKATAAVTGSSVSVAAAWLGSRFWPDVSLMVALVCGAAANLTAMAVPATRLMNALPGTPAQIMKSELREMIRMGTQARIGSLANLGFDPIVRFLLLRYGGAETSGHYEIAYRLVMQIRSMLVASIQVMVPRLVQMRALGTYDAASTASALTLSTLRLASPALWITLLGLPILSIIMVGQSLNDILAYGIMLATAWLINLVAAPAYFSNFVEGSLRPNRQSHLATVILAALLGLAGGLALGGLGVVAGTAIAIIIGSIIILVSRRRDIEKRALVIYPSDLWILSVGLLTNIAGYFPSIWALHDNATTAAHVFATITFLVLTTEHIRRIIGANLRLL